MSEINIIFQTLKYFGNSPRGKSPHGTKANEGREGTNDGRLHPRNVRIQHWANADDGRPTRSVRNFT